MPRTVDDFVRDCDPGDSSLFRELFESVGELAAELDAESKAIVKLRFKFEQQSGWSLILQHPCILGEASLLWGFPSQTEAAYLRGTLTTRFGDLRDARIESRRIAIYARQLRGAGMLPVEGSVDGNLRATIVGVLLGSNRYRLVDVIGGFVDALGVEVENDQAQFEPAASALLRLERPGWSRGVPLPIPHAETEAAALDQAIRQSVVIRKTPGVQGGEACIRDTRHTVAGLAQWRTLGLADHQILERHPDLSQGDLDQAWAYYDQNREEVDQAIFADQEA